MNHITETITGVTTLRAFNKQDYFIKEFIKRLTPKITSLLMIEALGSWARVKLYIASFIIFFFVILFSIILLVFKLTDNYNSIGLTLTFTILLSSTLSPLMFYIALTENNIVSIERIKAYLNNETEELEEKPKK